MRLRKLSPDELAGLAETLATKIKKLENIEAARKAAMEGFSDEMKLLRLEIHELAEVVRSGKQSEPDDELPFEGPMGSESQTASAESSDLSPE